MCGVENKKKIIVTFADGFYYAQQSKKSRELFIFKNITEKIMCGVENKKKIIVTFADGTKKTISPYYMASSELELKNYLFSYDEEEKKFKNFTLRNIKAVYVTEKKVYEGENDFVREVIENFDPFLSYSRRVKVKFTDPLPFLQQKSKSEIYR